jgi:hypothetical protein
MARVQASRNNFEASTSGCSLKQDTMPCENISFSRLHNLLNV